MSKFQVDASVLSISLLAAAFGFTLLPGPFYWIASIGGLSLAIILLTFDREGYRSVMESLGHAMAVSLCLTLAAGALMRMVVVNQGQPPSFEGRIGSEWMPFFWLGVAILLWVVDRTRMSGRIQYGAAAPTPSFSFTPAAAMPAAPRTIPVEVAPAPAPVAAAGPKATFTRPSFGTSAAETPEPAPPVYHAPPVSESWPTTPQPPPTPPTAVTPPAPVPIPSGKETMIYVTLVGEGMNVLRAVRAEHLGRDFYKIVEEMPEGETWQFGPGQVVRCKKKNLSSGKAMVATEEAPRAH